MKPTIVNRRGRALASLTATLGLALGAATVATGPAQSAAPAPECTPYTGTLTKGDAVNALSVTSGTTPETFGGEYLGTIEDGIAPGVDMIMVKITAPNPDDIGGIWQGMSGSPVTDPATGDVIGAISYGLSWGPSWIAGVTPYQDMTKYLTAPAASARVKVSDSAARTIASNSDVSRTQAAEGFAQLRMPTGVSGVSSHRLKQAGNHRVTQFDGHRITHNWLPKATYRMGAAASAGQGAGPETVVPGGNLAATLSYGDITMGGVGTVTAVCNGKVLGFGHPMTFAGKTSLTLHPADALFIQPESLGAPFKVANLGAPAGTISDDHLTGITGFLGAVPDTTDVTSTVSYHGDSRTGASHVSVPDGTASAVFYETMANHDRVLDGIVKGSEQLTYEVTGQDADGTPFDITIADRYASDYDITWDAGWEVADFTWALSNVPGVVIDSVTMSSAVDDDHSTWTISKVEQKVQGVWVKIGSGHAVRAKAGQTLPLRATLTSGPDTKTVPVEVKVPANASGSEGVLQVIGGSDVWSRGSYPRSVAEAEKYADNLVRNDQVLVALDLYSKRQSTERTTTTDPQEKVVSGHKRARLFVK